MGKIPQFFRNTGEKFIGSFDSLNLTTGRGVQKFYGYQYQTSAAITYALADQITYTHSDIAQATSALATWTKMIDLDFDLLVQRNLIIDGDIVFNVPAAVQPSGSTALWQVQCRLRKWDGTTETELDSCTGEHRSDAALKYWMFVTQLTTAAQRKFKVGETIRLTVELWGRNTGAASTVYQVAFNPQNTDDTGIFSAGDDTNLIIHVPFIVPEV